MATLGSGSLRLPVILLLVAMPLAAHAGLRVATPPDAGKLQRGDLVSIEFTLDVDTTLDVFEFAPQYDTFAGILQLAKEPTLAATIAGGSGPCNAGACSFFYLPAILVPKDTVAARWDFRVKQNAPIGPFALDLKLFVNGEPVPFPQGVQLNVVPEPPVWLVMISGLALVGARAYRRRCAAQHAAG